MTAAERQLADAADAARKLKHIPLRQGRTFECPLCGEDGLVGPDGTRVGDLFTKECS
jgi:hypothetical protein